MLGVPFRGLEDTAGRATVRLAMWATLHPPAEEPMQPARSRLAVATGCFSIALLAAGAVAQAANLFTATPFGTPFLFGNSGVLVTAWSQSTIYTNVSITAPLLDSTPGAPIHGIEGVVYLVTRFGPGTTPADNVVPPVTVAGLSGLFTPRLLFSGLTLGPGTYYVVWAPTNHTPHLSMSPEGAPNSLTTGIGVSFLGIANSDTVDSFPPATNTPVTDTGEGSLIITVTGDPFALIGEPTPVPTLSVWGTLALAALLALLTMSNWSRRRQTRV